MSYVDLERPTSGPDDVVVRSRVAGVCRTDLEMITGGLTDPRWVRFPLVPEARMERTIEEVGEHVQTCRRASAWSARG